MSSAAASSSVQLTSISQDLMVEKNRVAVVLKRLNSHSKWIVCTEKPPALCQMTLVIPPVLWHVVSTSITKKALFSTVCINLMSQSNHFQDRNKVSLATSRYFLHHWAVFSPPPPLPFKTLYQFPHPAQKSLQFFLISFNKHRARKKTIHCQVL